MNLADFLEEKKTEKFKFSDIFLIVDQMNIYIRGFAVGYGAMQNSRGQETSAIYLFLNQLFSTLRFFRNYYPNSRLHPIIVSELGKPTRSVKLYSEYKLGRRDVTSKVKHRKTKKYLSGVELIESKNAFSRQLQVLDEFFSLCSPIVKVDNIEADVVLSMTLDHLKREFPESLFVIYSGDKDLFQLNNEEENVRVLNPVYNKKGFVSKTLIWNKLGFKVPFFNQIPFGRALIGDPSDNIPGISQFGPARVKSLFEIIYSDLEKEAIALSSARTSDKRIKIFSEIIEDKLELIKDKALKRLVKSLLDEKLLEYQVYYRLIDLDPQRLSEEEYPLLAERISKNLSFLKSESDKDKNSNSISEAFKILLKEGIVSFSENDLRTLF